MWFGVWLVVVGFLSMIFGASRGKLMKINDPDTYFPAFAVLGGLALVVIGLVILLFALSY